MTGAVGPPRDLAIDPDIRRAWTLPAAVYRDPAYLHLQRERVFAPAWHWVPEAARPLAAGDVVPFPLLPGFLDEPLVLTHDGAQRRCLSNVCTHRGNLVVAAPGNCAALRCGYHGRRFGLDGRLRAMPGFDGVEGFPAPSDDLPRVALEALGPLAFASVAPAVAFDDWVAPVRARAGWLPLDALRADPAADRDYEVRAHWALYCDNYLEGFHIPFVHAALDGALAWDDYRTELFPWGSLQVGVARGDDAPAFAPPPGDALHGVRVAAYYFWLYPNAMLNLYPWGLSLNVVAPRAVDATRVHFRSFVWDAALRARGAGAGLDAVEREDEAIVEAVARGVRARLYDRGRYSPTREAGVHHFHRLLAAALTAAR